MSLADKNIMILVEEEISAHDDDCDRVMSYA
jgi:hypothetical protein